MWAQQRQRPLDITPDPLRLNSFKRKHSDAGMDTKSDAATEIQTKKVRTDPQESVSASASAGNGQIEKNEQKTNGEQPTKSSDGFPIDAGTLADIPRRPPEVDALSFFAPITRTTIAQAIQHVQGSETSFTIVKRANYFEMVIRKPALPILLTNVERMLRTLSCPYPTAFFVWDVRIQLISTSIVLNFLRSRPFAGALVELPGICMLQLEAADPEKAYASAGGLEVIDPKLKHRSRGMPLQVLSFGDQELQPPPPDAPVVDSATESMLICLRDFLEVLSGESTPLKAHSTVHWQPPGYHVRCSGHNTVRLYELRRLAQLFPFHTYEIYCGAQPEAKTADSGLCIDVAVRPYTQPLRSMYAPVYQSTRFVHV